MQCFNDHVRISDLYIIYWFTCSPTNFQQKNSDQTRKLSNRKDDRAMRPIYEFPENFWEFLTMPTVTFPENFNWVLFRQMLEYVYKI